MEFKDLEQATAAYKTLQAENASLQKQLEESNAIAEEAVERLNELLPQVKTDITAKVGKDTVVINFGIIWEGEYRTPEELSKLPKALAELVKKRSGAITIRKEG